MTDEQMEFSKKVNIDKAIKKINLPIVLIVLSISTYVIPLILGEFDFGIVFEIASLVFLLISRFYMLQYDENRSKRYIILSILAIGWILIYDIIIVCSLIFKSGEFIGLSYSFFWGEILSFLYLISLFAINKDLSKAENPIKYKESTDWFYEKYEDKKK